MFEMHRKNMYRIYNQERAKLIKSPNCLIEAEKHFSELLLKLVQNNLASITEDYNEASYLYPFWQNYPPDDRGRQPRGDQFPWIEVGEHSIGAKLPRILESGGLKIKDTGIPAGPDQRFLVSSNKIKEIFGFTEWVWLFIDIKSVGPRDNFDHAVMSHNQISGDGKWEVESKGIENTILTANGKRTSHAFHCSIPPLYVLSNGCVAPVINFVVKPIYAMPHIANNNSNSGQPLDEIKIVSIPNGILLTLNPGYINSFPELLYPGKDDKSKNPLKVRARISFEILRRINSWRVQTVS